MSTGEGALHQAVERLREGLTALSRHDQAEGQMELAPVDALDVVGDLFGLTNFERGLLMLCAAAQLDAAVAERCREHTSAPAPSFALASRLLADGHLSALHPVRPLRWWRLLDSGGASPGPWTPLQIDPRILHQLLGMPHIDERLDGIVQPLSPPPWSLPSLVEQGRAVALRLGHHHGDSPVVVLGGAESSTLRAVAYEATGALGLDGFAIRAADLPREPEARQQLARLWCREVLLSGGLLLVDTEGGGDSVAVEHFVASLDAPVLLLGASNGVARVRPTHVVEVRPPTTVEVLERWRGDSGQGQAWSRGVTEALSDYRLGLHQLEAVRRELIEAAPVDHAQVARGACRAQVRGGLDGLAQPLDVRASWDDLVLPQGQRDQLQQIIDHVRHRHRVYETWGLADKGTRGLGICALFHGASGTGKTTAAEAVAGVLDLALYRVDLSQVVSKYIGETEKKLERIFTAADGAGVVLLFDEADALFGRRTEVRDSHDRYANIEVSYLLQRIETYRGLALLTS
ncbi:MAG: ATP-binding protein, partial [Deltaproteobacteria bacterium]|nr:ATP-binding protein [Deltaproteobacteria bacterium]